MTELTGSGAITQEYLDELKVKNPTADILKNPPELAPVIQDAGVKELINSQEVVS